MDITELNTASNPLILKTTKALFLTFIEPFGKYAYALLFVECRFTVRKQQGLNCAFVD
jgi:hypothetical protein